MKLLNRLNRIRLLRPALNQLFIALLASDSFCVPLGDIAENTDTMFLKAGDDFNIFVRKLGSRYDLSGPLPLNNRNKRI